MTQLPLATDLETTGLHPANDHILEVALVLLDPELNVIDEFGSRVIHANEQQLSRMNDFVRSMHHGTGLLEEVQASQRSLASVDEEIADWLAGKGLTKDDPGIILGSSCRLDLYMIELQMPKTSTVYSHRMLDVSGYRELTSRYAPELKFPQPVWLAEGENTPHRALSDARWSIAEARLQRETVRETLDTSTLMATPDWEKLLKTPAMARIVADALASSEALADGSGADNHRRNNIQRSRDVITAMLGHLSAS